ncbi:iron dicitrate transport regulator FecR [Brenneria alni]|uniref:Iron dicitrate transport regulator FecR n=1 Tax=Brenneria alni TaxID=71656 RepID=A0A421DM67_9GAMM|nr:FecR domain-containing protein [Brenneria alni]RLM21947.1 iron dicitrate transport regulator FecR [Brenneria alni]
MISTVKSAISKEVLYAAAQWYATLYDEDCTEHDRQQWQQWLLCDDEHRLAWQQVEQIHARFHAVDRQLASSVLSNSGQERRRMLKLLVIASLSGAIGFGLPWESYAADYRTGTGGTRELKIADGITVWLNTDSALNQRSSGSRALTFQLVKGELMLENRTAQPAGLITPHGKIDAPLPCQIALRYTAAQSFLSVFSGDVMLHTAIRAQQVVTGQQVVFTQDECSLPMPVESFRQSWRTGVLVADNMRLDQLVSEVSRYHNGYFHVDKLAAPLRISGVFPLRETDRLLDALVRTLPVKVTKRFSWWIDIRQR